MKAFAVSGLHALHVVEHVLLLVPKNIFDSQIGCEAVVSDENFESLYGVPDGTAKHLRDVRNGLMHEPCDEWVHPCMEKLVVKLEIALGSVNERLQPDQHFSVVGHGFRQPFDAELFPRDSVLEKQ